MCVRIRAFKPNFAIVHASSKLCGDASGEVSSMYSTPNSSSACAMRILSLVVKFEPTNCSPSRNVDSIMLKCSRDITLLQRLTLTLSSLSKRRGRGRWHRNCRERFDLAAPDREDVIDDAVWDIDAGRCDAVAELDRVIHFVHQIAALWIFQQIDADNTTADGARRGDAQLVQLPRHRTILRMPAPCGVGNPVIRSHTINRGNGFIADDERADIAPWFSDILLDVENRMMVRTEDLFVFQYCFGRFAIIDFR